jgi:O-antigen ligase
MKHLTLNRIFGVYLVYFALTITGIIPRATVPYITALLIAWSALASLESATLFFVRSIPLFIAIPLTASYDNLNMWRPLALVLLGRMLWQTRQSIIDEVRGLLRRPNQWLKSHPTTRRLCILVLLAGLSLISASHLTEGMKRIIYFVNLTMVPLVVYALIRQGRLSAMQAVRNLAIPTIVVVIVGYLQLASTYLFDVYQFMRVWGEGIQLNQFGSEWSHIAVWVGNTWLAYYGEQLSLRVFSLFPDSHSFPTFVLLGIPALFAISLDPILRIADREPVRRLVRTYSALSIVWVPLAFLAAILSGTRGIWAASVGVAVMVPLMAWLLRHLQTDLVHRRMFMYIGTYLVAFFMLFAVAWPIFISPQFLVGKSDLNLLGHRLRSVIDFGETSNALRIAIWKASIHSITQHPWLGVGIGNYPVVLNENIELARAGSTAHNLYLHVAAEMGIPAALEMTILLAAAWWGTVRWFRKAAGGEMVYAGALILYLPWVLAYVMTDPIIFDERVFLMFATTLAIIFASQHD